MVGFGDILFFHVPSVRIFLRPTTANFTRSLGLLRGDVRLIAGEYVGDVAGAVALGGQGRSTIQSVERETCGSGGV